MRFEIIEEDERAFEKARKEGVIPNNSPYLHCLKRILGVSRFFLEPGYIILEINNSSKKYRVCQMVVNAMFYCDITGEIPLRSFEIDLETIK